MTLLPVIVIAIVVLLLIVALPSKKPHALASVVSGGPPRSLRDLEIDDDLQFVGQAYRESEAARRRREAIAKIAAIHDANAKAK